MEAAAQPPLTAAEVLERADERGLDHIKVGVFDTDGVLRGKWMSRAKLESALAGGFGFCDVVLGWDVEDRLYDNTRLTGWHTGYPDAAVRLLPATLRELPFEFDGRGLLLLGEFAGAHEQACPRGVLRRVADRAAAMGFATLAALEYEFFLFRETPQSARAKGWRGLEPLTPGNFGYSVLRTSVHAALHEALLATCKAMRLPLEGLHTETGPGVMEAAIEKADVLEAADRAALFKTFAKVTAQRNGVLATFMARWSNAQPGQSGHIHLSLRDAQGRPVFHDGAGEACMSRTMRHFLGGQQRLLPELLAMVAPTVNSYRRLVPGFWAPTAATWGIENRTTALRVVTGPPEALRVEFRIAAADGNPYLALAAALGAGLWGVEHAVEPTEPATGNAYDAAVPEPLRLPASLGEAAARLRASAAARSLFGDGFVEHFAATREWEEREFRKAVTDWELERYFEIV